MVDDLLPRMTKDLVTEALSAFRVVIINGPRQAGKSTLLNMLGNVGSMVTLDDRQMLRAARTDPTGFVEGFPRPLFIDEVQRGGDPLILAIKSAVDRRHMDSGQYVLAGSSRFLTVPQLSESLAGRARIIDLWPLSQTEITGNLNAAPIIDRLFNDSSAVRSMNPERCSREEIMSRVVTGGFPAVLGMTNPRLRSAWFDDYLQTLIRRDLTELSRIRQGADLPRLVQLLAGRTGQELNVAALARHAQLGEDATRAYLALVETIYLIFELPAWASTITARAKRRPKLHFVDSGVAANLLDETVASLSRPISANVGALLETFVVSEFARLQPIADRRVRLGHYRDSEKREVDLVLEARDGSVVCVEVKAALDVDDHDFRHMAYLRHRLGDRFRNGVVMHLGTQPLSFGDRLTALPVSALWSR